MPKDGFLTPKAIANRMKAKGLQKLRWYCQMCEKQCRDDNGFKCHIMSEGHQRQMMLFNQGASKFVDNYSKEFKTEFLKVLSSRYNTRRVHANVVYQEYISDKSHIHMNATRWNSLSEFVAHLGREGIAVVDETEKGWFIQWIDNSPRALARRAAAEKKERSAADDEKREQRLINEQIVRATGQAKEVKPAEEEVAMRCDEEKITLNLSLKPATSTAATKSFSLKKIGAGLSAVKPVKKNAFREKEKELRAKRKLETTEDAPHEEKRSRATKE
ncbi:domain of Kin17 curved DNA-binding protein-domain-containing protein [Syncephalis pseudoplumigaleata]|uniref:Domain of Kin17 curved DNA-binding protein-domain-containing protein n=1 Tax=Syncephalis pseudoplumigaleata TaxID=1712513 RepID=A0A4P9YT48_9FUNG|nr:domain of Kin17 curved DNA-binding protein-domain-containing protein [Syncephalis pseudoplumigaleata]|eukprot:RKP22878.1 domain of Kin17 curved DNA-binding protein-domain-containing protein [Syncephalis pseudoplumigaleata]